MAVIMRIAFAYYLNYIFYSVKKCVQIKCFLCTVMNRSEKSCIGCVRVSVEECLAQTVMNRCDGICEMSCAGCV